MELLITLTVAAILVGIAAPSFRSMIQQSEQESHVMGLNGMLAYARSEAIKRASRVSVCARASGESCGTDWNGGWVVFIDDKSTPGVVDSDEVILKLGDPLPDTIDLENKAIVRGVTTPLPRSYIRFGPRGLSNWRGGGTFAFCDDRGSKYAMGVNVSMSGDVRRSSRAGDGDLYDAFGNKITCPEPTG